MPRGKNARRRVRKTPMDTWATDVGKRVNGALVAWQDDMRRLGEASAAATRAISTLTALWFQGEDMKIGTIRAKDWVRGPGRKPERYSIKASTCLCGYTSESASPMMDEASPKAGDYTVCFRCGRAGNFIQEPDGLGIQWLDDTDDIPVEVRQSQAKIRHYRETHPWRDDRG
jgi:hypothetical protein